VARKVKPVTLDLKDRLVTEPARRVLPDLEEKPVRPGNVEKEVRKAIPETRARADHPVLA